MPRVCTTLLCAFWLANLSPALQGQVRPTSIRQMRTLASKDAVEIELEASDRLAPQTRVLTGPDRLVVDFPNALPGPQLRNQAVNRGEVRDVRVGLFQSQPPVTRVVLDLKAAQSFQIFPNGRNVIIKVSGNGAPVTQASERDDDDAGPLDDFPPARPSLVNTKFSAHPMQKEAAHVASSMDTGESSQRLLDVSLRAGLLSIRANKANLSEVLFAVHQQTGAEVAVPAGAEQEQIVADIGPAPAPEVLARLLYGSSFNFLIVSSPNDPRKLDQLILSPKVEGGMPLPQMPVNETADEEQPQPPPVQTAQPGPPPVPPDRQIAPAPAAPTDPDSPD